VTHKEVIDFLAKEVKNEGFIVTRESSLKVLFEISKKTETALIGKCAGTLQELATTILKRKFINPSIMTDQQRLFVIRKILKDSENPLYNSLDYIKLVDSRIRELKEHNISPFQLKKCSEKADGKLKQKIITTAKLLEKYNRILKENTCFDIFTLFEKAKGGNLKEYKKIILLFLPQILPLEIEFLKSLKIPVTIVAFKDNDTEFTKLFRENRKLFKNWQIIEVQPDKTSLSLSLSPQKGTFEKKEIYEYQFFGESEGIKKVSLIVKYLISNGVSPEKIAVISRNLNGKELLFHEYFKFLKIPFRTQKPGIPVQLHPLIKKFLRTVENGNEILKIKEWIKKLKTFIEDEEADENIRKELSIILKEIEELEKNGIVETKRYNCQKFIKLFPIFMENRTYIITEEEPLGVFIGTPEAAPTIFPEHIIFYDISNGIYPRSFPFDPDFSYKEREEINKLMEISNPLLEALPGRDKLILYELQTFYNAFASAEKTVHLLYDHKKGESLFSSIVSDISTVKNRETNLFTEEAINTLKVYQEKKEPETNTEFGVKGWKQKFAGDKIFNFIIDKNLIQKYLSPLTVTDIVSFFDCPTNIFFSKVIDYTVPPSIEIAEGQIYHEFINRAYRKKEKAEIIFEEVFDKFEAQIEDNTIRFIKPFIKENALKFIKNFEPKLENLEQEKPVTVKFGNLSFSGRIDWLESSEKEIKLVDFKRGNVTDNNFKPGRKKSFQIILYGLAIFNNGDIIKTALDIPNIKFSFVSVPKFNPRSNKWYVEFNGKDHSSEIKRVIAWVDTGIKLMEKGFFPALEIKIGINKKNNGPKVQLFAQKYCQHNSFLTKKDIKVFENKIVKIHNKLFEKLWS